MIKVGSHFETNKSFSIEYAFICLGANLEPLEAISSAHWKPSTDRAIFSQNKFSSVKPIRMNFEPKNHKLITHDFG